MRKLYVLLLVVLLCGTQNVLAQTNLSGRVYYNANIMADEMNKMVKDAKSDITKKRNEMIAKKEKDLGRKLNQKELAMIDEGVQKGQKMMDAVRKGMKTAMAAFINLRFAQPMPAAFITSSSTFMSHFITNSFSFLKVIVIAVFMPFLTASIIF